MKIGMYADQTGLFSNRELNEDNWEVFEIPEWILQKWYDDHNLATETAEELDIPIEEASLKKWVNEVSFGEDTDGLYQFCVTNGYTPENIVDTPAQIFYEDPEGKHIVLFKGTCKDCRNYAKKLNWEYGNYDLDIEEQ